MDIVHCDTLYIQYFLIGLNIRAFAFIFGRVLFTQLLIWFLPNWYRLLLAGNSVNVLAYWY